jgi:hypothetical protein
VYLKWIEGGIFGARSFTFAIDPSWAKEASALLTRARKRKKGKEGKSILGLRKEF